MYFLSISQFNANYCMTRLMNGYKTFFFFCYLT